MKTTGKVLIGVLAAGTVVTGFAIAGMMSEPKIEKKTPESSIKRVSSESKSESSSEAAQSESVASVEAQVESTGTPSVSSSETESQSQVVKPEAKASESKSEEKTSEVTPKIVDPRLVKELTYKYGTSQQETWGVRDRILTNVYQHVRGEGVMAGFAVRMTEVPGGFDIYAGQQDPGALIGKVTDNGGGIFTFNNVNGSEPFTFNA